jgi:H+/Cl- antiporter ClcA
VVLGVVLAAVAFALRAGAARVHDSATRRPAIVAPLGGAAVGALALAFGLTGQDGSLVLFSGQDELGTVVSQGPTWGAGVLMLLLVAKAAAYSVSLGSGFRGGPVFPALFLGAGAGMALSLAVPGLDATPAVVAGLAAGSASMLRLPVTSVMLAVLIAGQPGIQATTLAIVAAVVAIATTLALAATHPAPPPTGIRLPMTRNEPPRWHHARRRRISA